MRDCILDFIQKSEKNEEAVYNFVNCYIAEIFTWQLEQVIYELSETELRKIIKHLKIKQ